MCVCVCVCVCTYIYMLYKYMNIYILITIWINYIPENPVNTPWTYLQTKNKSDGAIFGWGLYSGEKTLQFAIC